MTFVVVVITFVLTIKGFAQNQNPGSGKTFPSAEEHKNAKLSYKIISSLHATFGYDIYSDGKILIHQPTIPGVAGNDGFRSKSAAESVAKLVVKKISNGQMPPAVTLAELKELKAIP